MPETVYFDITPKDADKCTAKVSKPEYEYTGKDIGPGVSIVDNNGRKLIYRTDYTLIYDEGRTEPGEYSIIVNYKGNYSGTECLYFTIKEPVNLYPKISNTVYSYTGRDIGPGVSVTDEDGKKLIYKTDYTLTYDAGRTDAGTYSITVNYIGKYAYRNCDILYFDIVEKTAEECNARTNAVSYQYTGSNIGPGVTITDNNGRKLVYRTDYLLSYEELRTDVGRHYITVDYIGNYSGSEKIYFNIVPRQMQIDKLERDLLVQGFKVSWSVSEDDISGYQLQYSQYSNFTNSATLTYNDLNVDTVTRKSMGVNKKYYVHLRTFKKVIIDDCAVTLYSPWSDIKEIVTQECLQYNKSSYQISLNNENVEYVRFGTSVQGRPLEAYVLTNGSYKKTFVINFAIHGFEDSYYRDGKVLVDEANRLIEYYSKNPKMLQNMRLIIIPCLNPDGLISGTNNQRACPTAFGRCTANHIDMNRDFVNGKFFAVETRSYKTFLNKYKPDVFLDFHGWDNETIGSAQLCDIITPALSLRGKKPERYGSNDGYVIGYVHSTFHCPAAIVEFASPNQVNHTSIYAMLNKIIDVYH